MLIIPTSFQNINDLQYKDGQITTMLFAIYKHYVYESQTTCINLIITPELYVMGRKLNGKKKRTDKNQFSLLCNLYE